MELIQDLVKYPQHYLEFEWLQSDGPSMLFKYVGGTQSPKESVKFFSQDENSFFIPSRQQLGDRRLQNPATCEMNRGPLKGQSRNTTARGRPARTPTPA
jgi:hypothetical protein